MILESLKEFHHHIKDELTPEYYEKREIGYTIPLNEKGELINGLETEIIENTLENTNSSKNKKEIQRYVVPILRNRSSKTIAILLVDTIEYALGYASKEREKKR